MKGSIPQKVGRLLGNLLLHPQYLSRCLKQNIVNGTSPLALEVPWFSYAANDFLSAWLQPHMSAFEYGSGGSTLFLARRVAQVQTVEDNPKWHELVAQKLVEKSIANVSLRFCPFDFKNPVGFENSDYLHTLAAGSFDVIFIDGSEEWTQVRPVCFRHAEKFVKPGGIIVVDDSWRYPDLRIENKATRLKIFESVGPCRPGVTTTDVYFY